MAKLRHSKFASIDVLVRFCKVINFEVSDVCEILGDKKDKRMNYGVKGKMQFVVYRKHC